MNSVKVKGHWRATRDKWVPVITHQRKLPKYMTDKQFAKFKTRLYTPYLFKWKIKDGKMFGYAHPATVDNIKNAVESPDKSYSYTVFYNGIDYTLPEFSKIRSDLFEKTKIKKKVKIAHPVLTIFSTKPI